MKKQSYFQGTEEPTPKKKQYKSDPAIVVQPRFKTPLFRNYDYAENSETGPGAGWNSMQNFKSIKEFLDARRKQLKDKYKADDDWLQDDGTFSKSPEEKKKAHSERRIKLLKIAIDFPIDEQIKDPILGDQGTYSDSTPIGGATDYLPYDDLEEKDPTKLNFSQDYVGSPNIDAIMKKYINPAESSIYGLPDGISPISDLDNPGANEYSSQYGETNSGNLSYNKKPII